MGDFWTLSYEAQGLYAALVVGVAEIQYQVRLVDRKLHHSLGLMGARQRPSPWRMAIGVDFPNQRAQRRSYITESLTTREILEIQLITISR